MKTIIDRNADRLQDQEDIRVEMAEQIAEVLLRVCQPFELVDLDEWITEETNWVIYHGNVWIDTKTSVLISTETLYKKFKNNC